MTDQSVLPPKFFGRRKGRTIRTAKAALLERFLSQISLGETTVFDKNTLFGAPVDEVYLEIGFGDGVHLAAQALKHKNIGFIGLEVFQNGVANLLSLLTGVKDGVALPEKFELLPDRADNLRVYADDARLLFAKIPDGFVSRVYLLFPDPWPKNKHAGRRFVNPDNLDELARILCHGGILRIATDHKVYKRWVLHQMHVRPDFVWTAKTSRDWREPPADWVETKYQKKALHEGRRPVFFEYRRV